MARALSWFKQIYNFEFEKVLSDNGPEFKGLLNREHPFETMCNQLGIKQFILGPTGHKPTVRSRPSGRLLKMSSSIPIHLTL